MNKHNRPQLAPSALTPAAIAILSPEQFTTTRDVIARYSGVYLDSARQRMLEGCVATRLAATNISLEDYLVLLASTTGQAELQQLAELVVNHETLFFRNSPHMRVLRELVLPQLHRHKPPSQPLRLWSAGCATGEEAYSLAITVLEALNWPLPRPVEVWATDISEQALARARAGIYRGRAMANVPPALRARYFRTQGDTWTIAESVRSLVRFERLNLLEPFPPQAQGVDLIFCQNVTIYFKLETCRELMAQFHQVLPAGGMLFLGFSETLWNIFDGFHSREMGGAYVYYKESFPDRATPPVKPQTAPRAVQTAPLVTRNTPRHPAPQHSSRTPQRHATDQGLEALQRGRELLARGEAEAALEALRTVPPEVACAPQALALTARAHANRGDTDLAVAEARRALDLDMLLPDAELLLGLLYSQQGQWPSAVQRLERARYLDPLSASVSFHLAEAYRRCGRYEAAAREYRNTVHKLDAHPPDGLLDGVAVGWVRETCQRYLQQLVNGTR